MFADLDVKVDSAIFGNVGRLGLLGLVGTLRVGWENTYQIDDATWCGFLTGLLGEEQEALSSVRSPGSIVIGSIRLFAAKIA